MRGFWNLIPGRVAADAKTGGCFGHRFTQTELICWVFGCLLLSYVFFPQYLGTESSGIYIYIYIKLCIINVCNIHTEALHVGFYVTQK